MTTRRALEAWLLSENLLHASQQRAGVHAPDERFARSELHFFPLALSAEEVHDLETLGKRDRSLVIDLSAVNSESLLGLPGDLIEVLTCLLGKRIEDVADRVISNADDRREAEAALMRSLEG